MTAICIGCNKSPSEIEEYVEMAKAEETTPEEYVKKDGTYNPENEHFCCTECYTFWLESTLKD